MKDLFPQLTGCFQSVFPDLSAAAAVSASSETLAAWDSVAQITLLAAIAEEFGVEFEIDEYGELTSYQSIHDALATKLNGA